MRGAALLALVAAIWLVACADRPSPSEAMTRLQAWQANGTIRVENGRLRLRLERTGLPASFAGLEAWHLVLAVLVDQGTTWSSQSVLPVAFLDRLPQASS